VLHDGVVDVRVNVEVNVPVFDGEVPAFWLKRREINGEGTLAGDVTVTVDMSVTAGLPAELTMIVAVPTPIAVTKPSVLTVTILGSLVDQLIPGSVELEGIIVASRSVDWYRAKFNIGSDISISVGASSTVS
jgi:hypothetical protein